jgi:hypothetical protein
MTMSAEEFLQKKVRGIIEPMVSSLLMEKPKEPVRDYFFIHRSYL